MFGYNPYRNPYPYRSNDYYPPSRRAPPGFSAHDVPERVPPHVYRPQVFTTPGGYYNSEDYEGLLRRQELARRKQMREEEEARWRKARQEEELREREEAMRRKLRAEQEYLNRTGRRQSPSKERAATPNRSIPVSRSRSPPSLPPQYAQEAPKRTTTASPSASPVPSSNSTPTPAVPKYTPEQLDSAARTIQSHYRTHRSLLAISRIHSQFTNLKSTFAFPTTLDFNSPEEGVINVPVASTLPAAGKSELDSESDTAPPSPPKLAYTSKNTPLHAYNESLSRLLIALDGVESHGVREVRERRKAIVREVEKEAGWVERVVSAVWEGRNGVDKQQEGATVVAQELIEQEALPPASSDTEPLEVDMDVHTTDNDVDPTSTSSADKEDLLSVDFEMNSSAAPFSEASSPPPDALPIAPSTPEAGSSTGTPLSPEPSYPFAAEEVDGTSPHQDPLSPPPPPASSSSSSSSPNDPYSAGPGQEPLAVPSTSSMAAEVPPPSAGVQTPNRSNSPSLPSDVDDSNSRMAEGEGDGGDEEGGEAYFDVVDGQSNEEHHISKEEERDGVEQEMR